ncbi:dihydroorotate dehydrogenase [Neobacillus piezotolerans]|uniref:Dihydroorotate dehydrogenase n=1 Tax=Neobacillus piezotolerans TaxID=2259171 RepID=A0A3D8GQR9_9BACI|nr:dihydroorotate dehydrogenase [Neobacillus piezotolerans]RDU36677.1 dihydroorotate dehydrogenase [Neobacillus piezotolerans]
MPDWSYHTIFKPILMKLPPAFSRGFIHRGMSMISSTPIGEALIEFLGHMVPPKELGKHFFNVHFDTPVGLSGRLDLELSGLKAFQNLGFGFIEIGPVSLIGSPQREMLRIEHERERITGLTGRTQGLEAVKKELVSLKKKKVPFLIRTEGTINEINIICDELLGFSDAFIINSNVFESDTQFHHFRDRIGKPIILDCTAELGTTTERIRTFHPNGILIEGTSTEMLRHGLAVLRGSFGEDVPLIASGGVKEPADAVALLKNGASLILLGQEYVFSGPGLPKRINEAYSGTFQKQPAILDGWIWYWLFGFAITVAGFIALFFSMKNVILPYDEAFLGMFRDDILDFNSAILFFMAHDRMTLSGTMISGGIIYMQLARHGIRHGLHWARKAVNTAGFIGFLGIFLFIEYGYFDWLHGLFWLILLPFFITGFLKTRTAAENPTSTNLYNSRAWKLSLVGQLAFIVLGASLTIGGAVISFIGASSVFVPTDITYLCMSPEMLNAFNDKLIPVIAHDRAGFGSALLSVGLLVLMLALWGIREGERWVWWTFTIGAIPAFLAGIVTHFIIGYTDFIHLLPAYFALLLYVAGVICTAPFLLKKQFSRHISK